MISIIPSKELSGCHAHKPMQYARKINKPQGYITPVNLQQPQKESIAASVGEGNKGLVQG